LDLGTAITMPQVARTSTGAALRRELAYNARRSTPRWMGDPRVRAEEIPPFRGDPDVALTLAKTALLSQGFEILPGSSAELRAKGPGMRSTRQSALLGVSEFRFQIAASTLTASATLGGVASMKAFVMLFPIGLILSLVVLLAVLGQGTSYLGLWLTLPWLIVSPLMAALIERRTTRAVERLARSMAVAACPG